MPVDSAVAIRDVTFTHAAASEPLFADLTASLPAGGFTGVVGANGAGKTTLLKLIVGTLVPDAGAVLGHDAALYCEQRTDHPPAALAEFLDDWDGASCELRSRLGIEPDCGTRWQSLSHGERKRVQIGCALWQTPPLLAVDEPTNHIDAEARKLLVDSLRRYPGVGVLVSHDRELLDELCVQCIWLEGGAARVFPGGYTRAAEQRRLHREQAVRERDLAIKQRRRLESELVRRREHAAQEHRHRSKRGLSRKDSDARAKIDHARVTDSGAGAPLRQLAGRAAQARAAAASARAPKTYEIGISLSGTPGKRDRLLFVDTGSLRLNELRHLDFPALWLAPGARVAVTGPNGAGKTTLLNHLLAHCAVPAGRIVHLPQEVTAGRAREVLDEARALPGERLGALMQLVSRLGSRPERLLESTHPSPGEIRKLLLALGMCREPELLVLDEPTNHLDLPSIEALEEALAECPCGLLVVSHDRRFLDRLTRTRWRLSVDTAGISSLTIEEAAGSP